MQCRIHGAGRRILRPAGLRRGAVQVRRNVPGLSAQFALTERQHGAEQLSVQPRTLRYPCFLYIAAACACDSAGRARCALALCGWRCLKVGDSKPVRQTIEFGPKVYVKVKPARVLGLGQIFGLTMTTYSTNIALKLFVIRRLVCVAQDNMSIVNVFGIARVTNFDADHFASIVRLEPIKIKSTL